LLGSRRPIKNVVPPATRLSSPTSATKSAQSGHCPAGFQCLLLGVKRTLFKAILGALEAAGGKEGSVGYLRRLAIENSSAFASLLGKVLPTTLAADESNGGLGVKMVFERHIVWPDGHREIEGVTPKQLPAPSPVSVENNDQLICVEKPSQKSASDDQ
jgi:hypothetical protein